MWRRLGGGALGVVGLLAGLAPAGLGAAADPADHPALRRFLSAPASPIAQVRALRRIEARSGPLNASAWMEVWTENDAGGFRYQIAAEGGSPYIRSRVFEHALKTEQAMWASGDVRNGAITSSNYDFVDLGTPGIGLARIGVKPRRKDILLVHGSIFLQEEDGDLIRLQGRLSRTPSFWIRRVEVDHRYERIAGVRLPVSLAAVASLLFVGKSTMTVHYEYEIVNGERVGSPATSTRR
jgi:hypothetical protein